MNKNSKPFKWPGGKSTKTINNRCLLALLFLTLTACIQPIVGREQAFTAHLKLDAKAENYQRITDAEFLSPEGWLCYRKDPTYAGLSYGNFTEQTNLSAMMLLAEIHRYKSTKNMDAIYNINKMIGGLELLFEVTGIKGYPARAMVPSSQVEISWKWNGAAPNRDFNDPMTRYHWRGETGKSELAHLTLCLAEACRELQDFPKLVTRGQKLLIEMANYFLQSNQTVIGVNGQVNPDGDLTGEVVLLPIFLEISLGFNHFISMAIYSAAIDNCDDPVQRKVFEEGLQSLVDTGCLNNLEPLSANWFSGRNFKNDNMAFLTGRVLLLSKSFPYKVKALRALQRLWKEVRHEKNVFWYLLICRQVDRESFYGEVMMNFLNAYPDEKKSESVNFTALHESSGQRAPDLNQRPIAAFIWSEDPLDVAKKVARPQHYAAVDFLLAYWMARSSGLIKKP
jgi:hypothetical protein